MTLQERVESGSPQKWTRKQLPKMLIKKFFTNGIISLFPILGMILVIVRSISDKPQKKCYGGINEASADFGVEDVRTFKACPIFRWIYSAIWVAIAVAGTIIIYRIGSPWTLSRNDPPSTAASVVALVIIIPIFCGIAFNQIFTVWTFGNYIWAYACPKCFYTNTVHSAGRAGEYSWEHESLASSTRSGQHRTHTVYVDGKEVGGIYASHSGYDNYVTTKYTEYKEEFKCIHCGFSEIRTVKTNSKKVNERWERNNR